MTLRQSALATLHDWPAPSAQQGRLRDEFVSYAATHPDAWSRAGRPDHLTASALVLDASRSRVLLGLHGKVGLWLQFGGHLEVGDDTLAAAALREAVEESGIADLHLRSRDPLRLDRHAAPCAHDAGDHLDVQFVAVAPEGAQPHVSEESLDVRWFDVRRLPHDTDDGLRRLVRDATGG